ncbi:DNA-formamidopyrimidine glycosylase family protein [Mycoplasma phocimorsus]|uniref:DNA-formamidopyrimidine glycosylase family protein n=1 Tax=Mycoplasma phocimorsus TaxID=3045839 RepID=UPI0024BF43D8|nr:DNA-formamidopyrimidine glycosylase family protein [Mycoplasma phocimorsus]MDJ1646646.1 DNA-formamidopyrimidine glycosylase family protein [Mycoplasma phocimorsus]MDJ1647599.1 DNA-formamidopyrimidine glycosylase family protein [Mycoplasma phocimorsus]MDJ1648057.1 DNA-formamidopyrimidine glycosylase family protein [Mycoplasma phocimorsus]MDJ1648938.1 DNA-formamidopyrimidine glycosylase family protein [Mycoplasma phocimorsus]
MPELPEIITIKRAMNNVIKNKVIASVEIRKATVIKNIEMTDFERTVKNETITEVKEKNACLVWMLTKNKAIVSNPKQNGNFFYYKQSTKPVKNTLIIFKFKDESELHFVDPDQQGCFHLRSHQTYTLKSPILTKGVTAINKNYEDLFNAIYKKNKTLKWALKSGNYIIGIGDIYSDEILFKAGLHPFTLCKFISKEEARKIVLTAQEILAQSEIDMGAENISKIDPNTEIGMYKKQLNVYNREGLLCNICQTPIQIVKQGSEKSFICPKCQVKKS